MRGITKEKAKQKIIEEIEQVLRRADKTNEREDYNYIFVATHPIFCFSFVYQVILLISFTVEQRASQIITFLLLLLLQCAQIFFSIKRKRYRREIYEYKLQKILAEYRGRGEDAFEDTLNND